MDGFSRDDLRSLIETSNGRCVSIFMPTHRLGPQRQQDPIRLKNLINDTKERLSEQGYRDMETRQMLDPAWELVEDMTFWQHQSDGLALFLSPGSFRWYRLPLDLAERVVVADRFHVKPVLPMLSGDGRFFTLAISQGDIRLFSATRSGIAEIELEDVPRSLPEALRYDEYGQNQYYTNTPASATPGTGAARSAGSGMSLDENKENILRYFQKVDHGLHRYLRDEQAPLVLAGVEYLLPIYREANTYQHLASEAVSGNPDDLRPDELHERAWGIVQPIFNREQQEARDLYQRYCGANPDLASDDIRQIVPAAYYGRVATLFVDVNALLWGNFDAQNGQLTLHDSQERGDDDLLDLAAVHTIINSGNVYCLTTDEAAAQTSIAAVFRY